MSADAPPVATWLVTSSSRRGSSHGADVPNQDAVRCASVESADGVATHVVAVSDGHGGARYVRSDVGSRYAVDVAVERVSAAVAGAPSGTPVELLQAEVAGIVADWRDRVRSHVSSESFTDAEVARAGGADLGADPLLAYGATLLVAVVSDVGVGIAQIGDGDALIRTHGFATRPVPGDSRLVGGTTTSLCLDTAADDFRFAGLPASADPDLVLLASDGYGNSFADSDWWRGLVGDFAWFVDANGFDQLEAQLPAWLEESAHVGGDDVTVVVVARDPLAVAPSAPPEVVAPVPPPPPVHVASPHIEPPAERTLPMPVDADEPVAPTPAAGRSRAALLAVLAAIVVVAVVVAVVLLAGGSDTPGPDRPTTTPSGTSTPSDSTSPRPHKTRTPTPTPTKTPTDAPTRGGGKGGGDAGGQAGSP